MRLSTLQWQFACRKYLLEWVEVVAQSTAWNADSYLATTEGESERETDHNDG